MKIGFTATDENWSLTLLVKNLMYKRTSSQANDAPVLGLRPSILSETPKKDFAAGAYFF
tara:strand:+ start:154 stop:330 length:177 start_codon:yes stop_codon:yes gene_type:complete